MPKLYDVFEGIDLSSLNEKRVSFCISDIADIYAVDNADGECSENGEPSNDDFVCVEMKSGTNYVFDLPLQTTINLVRNFMRFKVVEALDLKLDKIYLRPGVNY